MISKGRAIVKEVITRLDGSLQYHAPSSRAKRDVCVPDVVLLISMKTEQLLSAHGSRTHSPSLLTTADMKHYASEKEYLYTNNLTIRFELS